MGKIQAKVIWITGASSGIGRQLALEAAQQGATVFISARREAWLNEVVSQYKHPQGKLYALPCDVTDEMEIIACVKHIVAQEGKLDIAIANAGFGVMGNIEKLSAAEWQRQFSVNVTGLALTCKHSIPYLKASKGYLALVGSVAAYLPGPNMGAYAASKAAVHSIGETLQVELRRTGVSCTTIHPGFVESNITRIDNAGNYHPERKDLRPKKLMWTTEKAAKVMLKAIIRRKKVYVFTTHGRVAAFIGRYFPSIGRFLMAKQAGK